MDETLTAGSASGPSGQSSASTGDERGGRETQQDGRPVDRVTELEAALATAQAEAADSRDKYLRERAEMENYKKRIERTYADLSKRSRKDLLLKLLGAVDNLERALAYDTNAAQEVDARNLVKGIRMTYLQFKELLNSEGLSEIKTVGEPFNPAVHEAIATESVDGKHEGEILQEIQKGYTIGDELLRPARVKVAS